jgi:hypothetical protein
MAPGVGAASSRMTASVHAQSVSAVRKSWPRRAGCETKKLDWRMPGMSMSPTVERMAGIGSPEPAASRIENWHRTPSGSTATQRMMCRSSGTSMGPKSASPVWANDTMTGESSATRPVERR